MNIKNMNDITYYHKEINFNQIIKNENLLNNEEALYLCDLSDIINKYVIWHKLLPRIQPFYAVKCNDHPIILNLLNQLGTGFDCASKGEINKVLDLNVHPDRIIFANPTKPISHLIYAVNNCISTMTYDSEYELYKIKKYYPNANLVLRIRCEAEKAQCPLGEKFGCDPEIDGPKLLQIAKDLGLNIVGISFHVGSGCMDYPVYERAICAARKLFDYGAKHLGYINMNLLDIGGGFPGDKNPQSMQQLSVIINNALERYFPDDNVRIISEPGRFFVASSHTLICKVHSKRQIERDGCIEKIMYFINDGVYGSFNCILYDHQMQSPLKYIMAEDENGNDINAINNNNNIIKCGHGDIIKGIKTYKSSVWGPTCDALDQICDNIYLPKLDINSLLIFENMGAYTLPIASAFNGFPLPKIKFFMNKIYKDATD